MNNNEINIESGERLSFYKLFSESEKGYHVEIPIIQRDYAQGRDSAFEVRVTFLDALYDYLEENKPNRDLDFVYGSLLNDDNGKTRFILLDGQQRLTTLFLLHWYLASVSFKIDELRRVLTTIKIENGSKVYLSKFTYETRTSSREFCDALMSNEINMQELLKPDEGKLNSLSKTIQDCGWYYLSWENDPTIQSMLVMLDAIHNKFSGKPEFFERLINSSNPVITFLCLNLKEFKLTDDLYIKMNSRGKLLTTFENFKAKFEQHIGTLDWESPTPYILKFEEDNKQVSTQEYFSYKIDTDWANLFWRYKSVKSNDNSFDDELMNFIRIIFANQYSINSKIEKDENLEFLIGTQVARKRKNYTDNITFHLYKSFEALTKDSITYLINAFENLTGNDHNLCTYLNETFYYDEGEIFKKVLRLDLTLPQRVQFHAYIKFLIINQSRDGLYDWMRVIHNLTENTRIDGGEEVARAIKTVEILLPNSNKVLDFLSNSNTTIEFFYGRQVQEEKIKSHLIKKSQDWKEGIERIEQHSYFKGQIGFLLEYTGILAYYEENDNCEWADEENINFYNKFKDYSNKAKEAFNFLGTNSNKGFLWERAVLSKGDYLIEVSPPRKNFLSTDKNTRDFSWKRLLRLPPKEKGEENKIWQEKRFFVKAVFDDKNFNSDKLKKSLTKICKSTPSDWRKYFIDNPELIRYCQQGFIRFTSPSEIILLGQSQLNHYHREMYSYNFYLTKFSGNDDFEPFSKVRHKQVKSGEESSFVEFNGWINNRRNFSLAVYYDDDDFLPNPYEIRFYKTKGIKGEKEYPDEIKSILQPLNFEWLDDDEWMGYWISTKTEQSTFDVIKRLCDKLKNLT